MKSRILLQTNPTEITQSSSRSFLLAASPKSSPSENNAVRRFELQHNSSPRFSRRRQERRKGQALLLAVLIMLLAALLSAGFLAVVSGNLNQSARIADKTRAIEASRAGIAYANAQLSGSSQGDLWRPIDVNPAQVPGNTGYDFYYSQLDKVQGWANTLIPPVRSNFTADSAGETAYQAVLRNYRNTTYGKFPDPNQALGDAPKFLVKVEELTSNPTAADYDAGHAGEIKITSIGLSDDDPNVFHRSIAYKVGRKKSPWASALRSISNWNFDYKNGQGGVPFAQVNADAATAATNTAPEFNVDVQVETKDAPQFLKENVPFNVVIVRKGGTSSVRGAVVIDVTPPAVGATLATLKLAKVSEPIAENEVIQKAAAIGVGSTIDLLNTGKPASDLPPNYLDFPAQFQPRGILTNGSTWLQGQIQLSELNKFGTKITTSGSIALDSANKQVVAPTGTPGPLDPDPAFGITTTGTLVSSSANNFPGTFGVGTGVKQTDLVNDGWNKINAQRLGLDYSTSRNVEPFRPAKIDSSTNLARYRALTRNSEGGVYIDNRQDIEKVGTTPMSQKELVDMWTSPRSITTDYTRNGTASPVATVGTSLEQKHLRGWIGPDEFMARGALIELFQGAGPSIRVTYDARSDANFNGFDPAKTARDANGVLRPGVYSEVLPWPKNGTIFAEGNVRIRGKVNLSIVSGPAAADFPSLTVVSLGNIYVEGPVSVDGPFLQDGVTPNTNRKKLMLMAKKNVVVNPTRLVWGHVDQQTLTTNTIDIPTLPRSFVAVPVIDVTQFKIGDVVEMGGVIPTTGIRAIIRGIAASTKELSVFTLEGTSIPANSGVKTQLQDAHQVPGKLVKYFVTDSKNAIWRRLLLENVSDYPDLRLTLDHEGERVVGNAAFTVETEDFGMVGADNFTKPGGLEVKVTNKRVDANSTFDPHIVTIGRADRRLRAAYNLPTPANTDPFPDDATDAAFTDATATGFSLDSLEAAMNATSHTDTTAKKGWKYKATKNAGLPIGIPYYFLASVGLRNDGVNASGVVSTGIKDIGPNDSKIEIPLATSVVFGPDPSSSSVMKGAYTDGSGSPAEFTVSQFGFDPRPGVTIPSIKDDVLTADQSFYRTDADADVLKSTLDSRELDGNFFSASYSFRQDLTGFTLPADVISLPLPAYRVRALKLENTTFPLAPLRTATDIKPINFDIDAYAYAQEGSWLVISGDYFRNGNAVTSPNSNPVRSDADGTATYIDGGNGTPGTENNGVADVGEYANGTNAGNDANAFDAGDFADLNRNGILDPGEAEAALRFVRYNYKINFYGAIVENQTAVVADVKNPTALPTAPPLVQGAVQDWMDKWAAYDSTATGANVKDKFRFITYRYDPSLALATPAANQLRVPITDDLIYQQ